MDSPNPKAQKRVSQIAELIKEGNFAIAKFLFELDDKLDTEIPQIKDIIARVKGDSGNNYVITDQDRKDIAKTALNLLDRGEIARQATNNIDFNALAKAASSYIKVKDGDPGHTPTDKELAKLIAPLIPEVDLDDLSKMASDRVLIELKPLIPTTENLLDDIPKFGEKVRDGLELLEGDERLDKKAVKGLEDWELRIKGIETRPIFNSGVQGIEQIIAGTNITVDNTNPKYPKVSSIGGGGGTYTGTAPIVVTGTVISSTQASTSQGGYLSNTDFTTFNNKVSSQWINGGSGVIYYNGGNVAIGTTNPASKLEVNGVISTTNAGTLNGDINAGLNGVYSYNGPSRYIRFNTNGGANDLLSAGAAMVVNYSGGQNVEFFGAVPATAFINGNLSLGGGAFGGINATTRAFTITAGTSQGANKLFDITNNGGTNHYLYVAGDGNVGIGITFPTQPLHVSGNARVTGAYYDSTNSPGTSGQALLSTVTGTAWTTLGGGSGTVTSITAGTGLSGGTITSTGTIALASTAVTAASYTYASFTVNAQGQLTAASSNTPVTSISNTDSSLNYSSPTGTVVSSLNIAHSNTWSAQQGFSTNDTYFGTGITTATSAYADVGNLGDNNNIYLDARSTSNANVGVFIRSKGTGNINLCYASGTTAFYIDGSTGNGAFINNVGMSNNKGFYLNGLNDSNWRIGRNLASGVTSSIATVNSIQLTTSNSSNEGVVVGVSGGNSIAEFIGDGRVYIRNKLGIGISPTAQLHVAAGSSSISQMKLTAGTILTTPVADTIENSGTHIYWTSSAGTRYQLDQQSGGGGVSTSVANTWTAVQTYSSSITMANAVNIQGTVAGGSTYYPLVGLNASNDQIMGNNAAMVIKNGAPANALSLAASGQPTFVYFSSASLLKTSATGVISGAVAGTDFTSPTGTETLTNKRINPRISTIASSATPGASADTDDQYNITALAANAVIAAPTGTPVDGQKLAYRIKDNATARTLGYNAIFRAVGAVLPASTVASKTLYIGTIYNAADSKWDVTSVSQE